MNKIPTPYIEDITKSIELIEKYIKNVEDKDGFLSNTQIQDSII